MKSLIAFLLALSFDTSAQTVWATTDSSGAVTGFYANAAPVPTPPNCCTLLEMSDARMVAYLTPTPSPQQIFAGLMAAGVTVTSSSDPSLNAVYSVTTAAQNNTTAIAASIAAGQGLPHGATSIQWLDADGVSHSFTAAQFLALADAIRNYVYDLSIAEAALSAGRQTAWPASTIAIP
jgi:hypothetical protein